MKNFYKIALAATFQLVSTKNTDELQFQFHFLLNASKESLVTCVLLNFYNKLLKFLPSVQPDFGLHAES